MPTSSRNRTGSLQRKRSVDIASETAVWPAVTDFCEPWPSAVLLHAADINCMAKMRARMPWPVAEEANGIKPTGVVPKRAVASNEREQQMPRHWLSVEKRIHKYRRQSTKFYKARITGITYRHASSSNKARRWYDCGFRGIEEVIWFGGTAALLDCESCIARSTSRSRLMPSEGVATNSCTKLRIKKNKMIKYNSK